jgi:hypothetical protein
MKRILLLGIILSLIVGCSSPFILNLKGYEVLSEPLDIAWPEVAKREYFFPDPRIQSPEQFEHSNGGICMGFAIDLMYHLGKDSSYVICKVSFGDPTKSHAIVKYHGDYIEPQAYGKYYAVGDGELISIEKEYSYTEAMMFFTAGGSRAVGGLDVDYLLEPCPSRKGITP